MTPEKRTPARWQLYATRLAWDKLRSARRLLDLGAPGFRVRADLEGALMWAIEAWLRRRGIRPDHANGWLTSRAQFYGAAPEELADRVRACEERLLSFGPGLHPPHLSPPRQRMGQPALAPGLPPLHPGGGTAPPAAAGQ